MLLDCCSVVNIYVKNTFSVCNNTKNYHKVKQKYIFKMHPLTKISRMVYKNEYGDASGQA